MSSEEAFVLPKELVEKMFGQGDPASKRWYDANCHCGGVRFRFQMTDLKNSPITHCNCSICTKNGLLNVYPRRDEVEWIRGYDTMRSYRSSTKTMDHKFCPTCGSSILVDFNWTNETQPFAGDLLAVNARMVKDFEDRDLNIRESNGKEDFGVPYQLKD